ncbi:hypothetical protein [Microlunatus sp. Y2014]|uniref:hypothetical protein n=1 Tax=Microlunatus sp. Y2014 TaxID=3418488 RepID=UPI003DA7869D
MPSPTDRPLHQVSAMYTLSWYDFIAFVPLGVLAGSRLDMIMIVRNLFLALAYVPGRVTDISEELEATASLVRTTVSPTVQWGVLAAIVVWYAQHRLTRARIARRLEQARPMPRLRGHQRRMQVLHRKPSPQTDR